MKRLFILTLGALVFAACAEDVENNSYKAEYITFSVTESEATKAESPLASLPTDSYVPVSSISIPKVNTAEKPIVFEPTRNDFDEPMMMTVTTEPLPTNGAPTRGTQNTTSTLKTNNATFDVNAYPTGTVTDALLDAATATYNSTDEKFHTGETWGNTTASAAYDFYAWYPKTLPTGTSVSGKTITYDLGSLTSTQMPDLLGACATNKKYEDGSPDKGTVDLTFKHLLVPVKFVLAANYAAGTIKSIKFSSIVKTATHDLSSADDATSGRVWGPTSTGEYTIQGLNTEGTSSDVQVDGTEYFMMIPQTIALGTTITITTEKNSKTYTLEYKTTSAVTWKAGQVVTYTIGATALTSLTVNYPSAWGTLALANCPVQAYTASDHLGLFAVNKSTGKIVIANLDITAAAGASFTIDPSSYPNYFFSDQNDYYIYYPYQSNLTTTYNALAEGEIYSGESDADTFFGDVIGGWNPVAYQNGSDLDTYPYVYIGSRFRAMDLQVAKLSSGAFAMAHQMSLAKITIKYKANVTNTILYTWNSSASTSTSGSNINVLASREFSTSSPYVYPAYHEQNNEDYIYYYIAKYNEKPQMIDADETEYKKWTSAITIQDESGNPLGKNGYGEFEAVSRAENRGWCYYIGNFPCRTAAQQFTTPIQGIYKIECWGASCDDGTTVSPARPEDIGRGGYVKGNISLSPNKVLYVYVGGMGTPSAKINSNYKNGFINNTGGYNGGGNTSNCGCGGGGATDVRIYSNGSWDNATSLASRIIVAGGGGGCSYWTDTDGEGGDAGGLIGPRFYTRGQLDNVALSNTGGEQDKGGTQTGSNNGLPGEDGSFGKGGNGYFGAGGSGWYGGSGGNDHPYNGSSNSEISGGGGSSFISGFSGCKAYAGYTSSTNESVVKYGGVEYEFTSGLEMWDGEGYKWNSSAATSTQGFNSPTGVKENGHLGDGYARITFVSE